YSNYVSIGQIIAVETEPTVSAESILSVEASFQPSEPPKNRMFLPCGATSNQNRLITLRYGRILLPRASPSATVPPKFPKKFNLPGFSGHSLARPWGWRQEMKTLVRILLGVQLLLIFTPFAAAKTHKDVYQMSCDALWKGVRDTIRNSGKYGIIGIDGYEMTASFNIGGNLTGKRINSVVLNRLSPTTCELQTQTAYSGLVNNDYGD